MKMKELLMFILVTVLFIQCEFPQKKEAEEPKKTIKPPKPVEVVRVSKGIISRDVRASGVAAGIKEAYVVSETQGKIEYVNFTLGQRVTKGHTLVQTNATVQKAAYEQAIKASALTNLNLKVTQKLFNEGNASQAELTNAQSQATAAQALLESTQMAFSNCRITAPISGFIAQKDITIAKGNILAGGALITRIVNIASLKTTIAVGEMEVGLIKRGMKVTITVPAVNNSTYQGRVTAIAAGSDPATGSYPVEIVWKNTQDLKIKSGMSVFTLITTNEQDSVILAPVNAIIQINKKEAVFVSVDNKAVTRFVTIGRSRKNNHEINNGLEIGDLLLTSGMTTVTRGDTLLPTLIGESGAL